MNCILYLVHKWIQIIYSFSIKIKHTLQVPYVEYLLFFQLIRGGLLSFTMIGLILIKTVIYLKSHFFWIARPKATESMTCTCMLVKCVNSSYTEWSYVIFWGGGKISFSTIKEKSKECNEICCWQRGSLLWKLQQKLTGENVNEICIARSHKILIIFLCF